MSGIAGVRFKQAGKVAFFDSGGLDLGVGDWVMVEEEGRPQLAWVVVAPSQMIFSDLKGPLRPVLRKATPEDLSGRERIPGQGTQMLVIPKEGDPS